jgi:hypothetical protein
LLLYGLLPLLLCSRMVIALSPVALAGLTFGALFGLLLFLQGAK